MAAGYRRAQERLISMASILLPNSQSEMRRIENEFPSARNKPWAVVPNAVDTGIFSPQAAKPVEEFRDSVMCVGRIEGRKCQLELMRALKETDLKLVLIGNRRPTNSVTTIGSSRRRAILRSFWEKFPTKTWRAITHPAKCMLS